MRPIGALEGIGGRDMGLEPQSGFWDSIHELRSLISSTSETSFCLRVVFDMGFLIVAVLQFGGDRRR